MKGRKEFMKDCMQSQCNTVIFTAGICVFFTSRNAWNKKKSFCFLKQEETIWSPLTGSSPVFASNCLCHFNQTPVSHNISFWISEKGHSTLLSSLAGQAVFLQWAVNLLIRNARLGYLFTHWSLNFFQWRCVSPLHSDRLLKNIYLLAFFQVLFHY